MKSFKELIDVQSKNDSFKSQIVFLDLDLSENVY